VPKLETPMHLNMYREWAREHIFPTRLQRISKVFNIQIAMGKLNRLTEIRTSAQKFKGDPGASIQ